MPSRKINKKGVKIIKPKLPTLFKPRDIVKWKNRKIQLQRFEEVQCCANCKYCMQCPIVAKQVAELKPQAKKAFNDEVIKGHHYPQDKQWVEAYNRQLTTVYAPSYIRAHIKGRCRYELREAGLLQALIVERYDITDPKVFIIAREIIKMVIQAYRIDVSLGMDGMQKKAFGRYGHYEIVNPLIKERQEYSKRIIEGIEKMDKLIYGTKVDIKLSMTDVLQKLDKYMDDQLEFIDVGGEVKNENKM